MAWLVIAISPVANILIPSGILIAERTLLVPSVGVVLAIGTLAPWVIASVADAAAHRADRGRRRVRGRADARASSAAPSAHTRGKTATTVFNTLAVDAPLRFQGALRCRRDAVGGASRAQAEIEWLIAIKLMPDYYGVRVDLAHKYRELHHCDEAIPMYQKALEIEPALPLARVGLDRRAIWNSRSSETRGPAALVERADGYSPWRVPICLAEIADSALVATDSGGGINQWEFYRGTIGARKP